MILTKPINGSQENLKSQWSHLLATQPKQKKPVRPFETVKHWLF
jgi:hypothetical protein